MSQVHAEGVDEFDVGAGAPPARLLAPAVHFFRGKALEPYSYARRLIANSVLPIEKQGEISTGIWTLSILFVMTLPDAAARNFLCAAHAYKAALYEFIDGITKAEHDEARKIVDEVLDDQKKAEVSIIQEQAGGAPEKKT